MGRAYDLAAALNRQVESIYRYPDHTPTRTQRALSLRLRPQVQALLPRQGRREGRQGAGQGGRGGAGSIGRDRHRAGAAEAANGPALEACGDESRFRPARPDAAQGRRQLNPITILDAEPAPAGGVQKVCLWRLRDLLRAARSRT